MKALLSAGAICLGLTTPAMADTAAANLSNMLVEGEGQLRVRAYAMPTNTSLETCGQNAPSGPWSCLIETYRDATGVVYIYYRKDFRGEWVINNWTAR